MSYIEQMEYTQVPGSDAGSGKEAAKKHLRVYALSTCAFCERAMNFLKDEGLAYDFLMVDNLEPDTKRALKAELKEKYGNIPVFPLLVVDGVTPLSGFTEDKWKEILGL